jgi:hypothetical protein
LLEGLKVKWPNVLKFNLSSRRFNGEVLPLFLIDADGQSAPLRVLVFGELPPVADVC